MVTPSQRNSNNGKIICYCCGAKIWTKVIAVFQILYVVTLSAVRLLVLSSSGSGSGSGSGSDTTKAAGAGRKTAEDSPAEGQSDNDTFHYVHAYVTAPLLFQVLECFVGLSLGSILLMGAHLDKPRCLIIWLIFRGLEIVVDLFLLVGFLLGLFMGKGLAALLVIILVVALLGIQIFSFLVVYRHCKALVEEQNPNLDSAIYFNSINTDV